MLSDYKKIYQAQAELIPNYKEQTVSQLCFKYLEYEKTDELLKDRYLAAIIIRGWNILNSGYYQQEVKGLTEEDVYDIFIESLLRTLREKAWENPENSLYMDKDGPEKALRVIFKCMKINELVARQRQKRKLNYNSLSLEQLEEDSSDSYYTRTEDKDRNSTTFIVDKVNKYFYNEEYFKAFILDIIVTSSDKVSLNERTLKLIMKNLNEQYCDSFSETYKLPYEKVLDAVNKIHEVKDFNSQVVRNTKRLARDKDIVDYLKE